MGIEKKKGALAIFILLALHNMFALIPYLAPSNILVDVMTDLSVPAAGAAYIITIFPIIAGIIMFAGSIFIDKFGYINSFHLAVFSEVIGSAICAISPNFFIFMIGRAFGAFGFGLNCTVVGSIAAIWFQGNMFTNFNTFNNITSCVGAAVPFMIILPLVQMVGSWKNAFWVFAIGTLIYAVICVFVIKYPPGVGEALAQQKAAIKAGTMPKPEFPLVRALKSRNFLLLMVIGIFSTTVSSIVQTYFPTYLTLEAGFDATQAGNIAGVGSLAGIIGSLLGGYLCAKTGRRKIYQTLSMAVYIIGSFIALLSGSYMIVLITYIVGNVGFYMRSPSMAQYLVEDAQPFDPSIIAPGAALTSGVPMLLNLVVSAVAGAMTVSMGYGTTLIIFVASAVVGLVACFFLTEVGPHAKQKEAA